MVSLIIYNSCSEYLERSIADILDKTPRDLIEKIYICNDLGYDVQDIGGVVVVLTTDSIGRAKAWNNAALKADTDFLVFIDGACKVESGWLEPLLVDADKKLISPVVHVLCPELWSMQDNRWDHFGWRWDLELYNRQSRVADSPSVSSYCLVTSREWFFEIGQFDPEMYNGYGEDIEISLRSWLFGGSCVMRDNSRVAVSLRSDTSSSVRNLARIVETWLSEYRTNFYESRQLHYNEIDCGRLNGLISLSDKQKRTADWFLSTLQPELFGIYKLKNIAFGKSVAIVGPSVSVDMINTSMINQHDIIVGVDYMGMNFRCDYVITDSVDVAVELRKLYPDDKFILPTFLTNGVSGLMEQSCNIIPGAVLFELGTAGDVQDSSSVNPPFCNFNNLTLTAAHFALYLRPSFIMMFGFDNKILAGKSHSSNVEYYGDGCVWHDSESTKRKLAFFEFGADRIGQLALKLDIPLLRTGHV